MSSSCASSWLDSWLFSQPATPDLRIAARSLGVGPYPSRLIACSAGSSGTVTGTWVGRGAADWAATARTGSSGTAASAVPVAAAPRKPRRLSMLTQRPPDGTSNELSTLADAPSLHRQLELVHQPVGERRR